MASNDIDYEIIGEGVQFVEIALDPGETVITEAGAMIYMEDGISWEAKMGDGSNPDQRLMGKFFSAGKRMLAGESLFLTHFTSNGSSRKSVGFAGNIPGSIVGIDLSRIGGAITCQRDAFPLCSERHEYHRYFHQKPGIGLFRRGRGVRYDPPRIRDSAAPEYSRFQNVAGIDEKPSLPGRYRKQASRKFEKYYQQDVGGL